MTIDEISKLPDKMPVVDLVGTVVACERLREGVSGGKDYKLLAFKVKDATGSIRCGWFEPTVTTLAVGTVVKIAAEQGKNGLYGASVSYRNNHAEVTIREEHCTIESAPTSAAQAAGSQHPGQQPAADPSDGGPVLVPTLDPVKILDALEDAAKRLKPIFEPLDPLQADALGKVLSTYLISITGGRRF